MNYYFCDFKSLKALKKLSSLLDKPLNLVSLYDNTYNFDETMFNPIINKIGQNNTNGLASLAAAIDYDNKIHPDETIFVTTNLNAAKIANLFFGEDSIILLDNNFI